MKQLLKRLDPLIQKGERFLRTDLRYVARGGFWLTLNQSVAAFASFVLAMIFARVLPKETYGNYKYVLSLAGILGALSLSGLGAAIVQAVPRGYEGLFKKSFWLNLRWSSPLAVVAWSLAGYYFWQNNTTLGWSLLIVGLFLPVLNSVLFYKSFLNGKKLFKETATYGLIGNLVPVAIVALAAFSQQTIILVFCFYAANTVVSLWITRHIINKYQPNDQIDDRSLTFGKHLSLINIIDSLATYLDKVLIFQLIGATSLAVYSFATAIPEQLRNFFKLIPSLAIPKFANRPTAEIKKEILSKVFKLVLLTTPVVIAYIIAAPLIYHYVFPQYVESIKYSQLFMIIMLVEGGLSGAVLKSKIAIRQNYILNLAGNISKIALYLVLIIPYGIWGIIWARIISRLISFVLSIVLVNNLPVENQDYA